MAETFNDLALTVEPGQEFDVSDDHPAIEGLRAHSRLVEVEAAHAAAEAPPAAAAAPTRSSKPDK